MHLICKHNKKKHVLLLHRWQTNSSKDTCTLLTFNLIASRDGEERKEMATISEGDIYGNAIQTTFLHTNSTISFFYLNKQTRLFLYYRFSSTSVP